MQIYLSGEPVSDRVKAEMAALGVVSMLTVPYPPDLSISLTDAQVRALIPSTARGPVCLDSEGITLGNCQQPSKATPGAAANYASHLKRIKRVRPKVQAAPYGFPPAQSYYWTFPEYGRHQFAAGLTTPVAAAAGCLTPNCYLELSHVDDEIPWRAGNTLRCALDLAELFGKACFAFVGHLSYPEGSESGRGLELITPETLERHVKALCAARGLVNPDHQIDGVVLWQASSLRLACIWPEHVQNENDNSRATYAAARRVWGDRYDSADGRARLLADNDSELIAALQAIKRGTEAA